MRFKRGAVLPGAIILSMLMLIISFSVAAFVVTNSTISNINDLKESRLNEFRIAHNQFVENDGDLSKVTNTNFKWESYTKDATEIKALCAYNKVGDDMRFYSIYDFSTDTLLAYQTSSFYITSETVGDEVIQYLGGIVPIVRS